MDKGKKDLLVFGYGLAAIATVLAVLGAVKHGLGLWQWVKALCAMIFVLVTALNWQALRPGYRMWMKGAHFIGGIITIFILSAVFFLLFAPIGVFFRMIGKDHLDRTIDKGARTYWILRPGGAFSKEQYQKQF